MNQHDAKANMCLIPLRIHLIGVSSITTVFIARIGYS